MYDARGEQAEGSRWEETGNQWGCKRRRMVNVMWDLWTWRKPELRNKTEWLVGEGSSADVGKYKLWILNGSNIDSERYKCMTLFTVWPFLLTFVYRIKIHLVLRVTCTQTSECLNDTNKGWKQKSDNSCINFSFIYLFFFVSPYKDQSHASGIEETPPYCAQVSPPVTVCIQRPLQTRALICCRFFFLLLSLCTEKKSTSTCKTELILQFSIIFLFN